LIKEAGYEKLAFTPACDDSHNPLAFCAAEFLSCSAAYRRDRRLDSLSRMASSSESEKTTAPAKTASRGNAGLTAKANRVHQLPPNSTVPT
jgi:hypothetical protein